MKEHVIFLNEKFEKVNWVPPVAIEDATQYKRPKYAVDFSTNDGEGVVVALDPVAYNADKATGLEISKQAANKMGLSGEGLVHGYLPWTTASKINQMMPEPIFHSCYVLDVKDPNPADVTHTCVLDRSGYLKSLKDNSVVMPKVFMAVYMSQQEFERRFPDADISNHIWYGRVTNVFDI